MITPKESPSREVLDRIASDYRRQGYEVFVEPRGADLPDFLSDATPDLIARRHDKNLVVEVKRFTRDVDQVQLKTIAQRIAKEPGWQFVLMAPGAADENGPSDVTTIDEAGVRELLREANAVSQLDVPAAALLCAWAAAEAAARLLITRSGIRVPRSDTATLMRSLVSEGMVTDDDFRLLNDAYSLRSSIAHGRSPVRNERANHVKQTTRALIAFASRMLTELPTAA